MVKHYKKKNLNLTNVANYCDSADDIPHLK